MKKLKSITLKWKIIIISLLMFVLIMGGYTTYIFNVFSTNMKEQLKSSGLNLTKQISKEVQNNKAFEKTIEKNLEDKILQASKVFRYVDMETLTNEKVSEIVKDYGVSEISVIGKDRKIKFSNKAVNLDWYYPEDHKMDPVFKGTQETYMEEPRENPLDEKIYKFGGLTLNNGYYVQTGIEATILEKFKEEVSIDKLLKEIDDEKDILYALFIDKNKTATAGSEVYRGETFDNQATIDAIDNEKIGSEEWIDEENNITAYEVQLPYYEDGEHLGSICIGLSLEKAVQTSNKILINTLFILIGVIAAIIIIYYFIINYSLKPLLQLADQVKVIATGDFNQKIDPHLLSYKDEIGDISRAVEHMIENLSSTLHKIKTNSEKVLSHSKKLTVASNESKSSMENVAVAVDEVAKSVSEQARDAEIVASKTNELSNNLNKSEEHTEEIAEVSTNISELGSEGKEILTELNEKTAISKEKSTELSQIVNLVNTSSNKVNSIIDMITEISEQTNLLALNASIEAARAGEAGKGFAVVANEIRELAERTNTAIEDIRRIFTEMITNSNKAQETVQEMNDINSTQNTSIDETTVIFNNINNSVEQLIEKIEEINALSDEIHANKEETITSIENISAITEETSASAEEISASTEEQLASIVDMLNSIKDSEDLIQMLNNDIDQFKI